MGWKFLIFTNTPNCETSYPKNQNSIVGIRPTSSLWVGQLRLFLTFINVAVPVLPNNFFKKTFHYPIQ